METVKLSDKLELTRVIVGCMRMMDAGKKGRELLSFVHECMELGMNCFDHAPVYGGTLCEKTFGDDVIKAEPGIRGKIKIVTKAGIVVPGMAGNRHIYYDSREGSLIAEVEASLKRLSTDHVDLLLIHRPDILGHPEETARALEKIVKDGKALEVGVSNYEVSQFEALQQYLPFPLVANQVEVSVKTTDNLFNGVIDTAMRLHTGIMAWSPWEVEAYLKEKMRNLSVCGRQSVRLPGNITLLWIQLCMHGCSGIRQRSWRSPEQ